MLKFKQKRLNILKNFFPILISLFIFSCNNPANVGKVKINVIGVSGTIKDKFNDSLLNRVEVWIEYGGIFLIHTSSPTLTTLVMDTTNSLGEFKLSSKIPDDLDEKEEIRLNVNYLDELDTAIWPHPLNLIGYQLYRPDSSYEYIVLNRGNNGPMEIKMKPMASLWIVLQTNDSLKAGDTLIINDYRYWPPYGTTIPDIFTKKYVKEYVDGDVYKHLSWKIKRNNNDWEIYEDSVYCVRFVKTEYILNY